MANLKGKIESVFEKTKKDGGKYLNVVIEGKGYICVDATAQAKVRECENSGEPIEFYTFLSKDGTATFMNLPKEGGSGGSKSGGFKKEPAKDSSFAASYSKDIVVSLINVGAIKESSEIDYAISHYFELFIDKLKG